MSHSSNEDINSDLSKSEQEIINLVEHYFSDEYIRKDKFMRQMVKSNSGGWFQTTTLLHFRELRNITQDPDLIVKAILKSGRGILEVSEDKMSIRRIADEPEELDEAQSINYNY